MMRTLRIFAGVVFTLMGVSSAFAGGDLTDPYAYTPPPPPAGPYCGGPFSGFYGGGVLGLGELSTDTTVPGNPPFANAKLNDNQRGFTIGGLGGYNWQCNGRLIGIESDISYFNADTTATLNCPSCTTGNNPYLSFGSEINWYGTLRGRVGLLGYENFLVYATGGLAYGGVDHTMQGGAFNSVVFSKTDSNTQIGWTAGGGAEILWSDHWAFRVEALYVDLGSQDQSFTTNQCSGTCTLRASYDDSFWVARIGLTYLFGGDPAPAQSYGPLK